MAVQGTRCQFVSSVCFLTIGEPIALLADFRGGNFNPTWRFRISELLWESQW